jgi:acyl-homoserine-lactone acylase
MKNPGLLTSLKNLAFMLLLFFNGSFLAEAQNAKTEILWDNYGVPHICAKNARDMYRAFGYAQMNNHANLILKLYGESRGKAAEYWGKDFLLSDRKILLFDIPAIASSGYSDMKPEYRSYLDAFAEGINKYASENPAEIDDIFRQVLPVTPTDVLSHTLRVIYLEFIAAEDIYASFNLAQPGSNAVAIAPSRSASKNAMLITNSHLPWSGFFTWFEAHLNCKGFMAYGISLVGTAPLSMAFNNNLGWAFTVNPIDLSDRYELKLKENGYLLDGIIVPFERRRVTIKIRQGDGSMNEEVDEFLSSKHGPVVSQNGEKAYAVRIAGLHNSGIFEQFHRMSAAKNLMEFESAMKMLQLPMFNIIYADRDGNIMYLFNGNVPVRATGDFAFWKGSVDGTDSKLIWNKIHDYNDLPKVINPSTGFISNCNDPPWTCTEPMVLNPADFPAYMSSRGTYLRPQRAVNMIKEDQSITFEELVNYKHDTHMEAAIRFLDDLLAAVEKYPDIKVSEAAEILGRWDMKTECDSRGAILFAEWWDMVRSNMFAVPWSPDHPNSTPDGLNDPRKAVELLKKAADDVLNKYGSLDVKWGDVYRFRINDIDFPANGGPGDYGIFRTVNFAPGPDNKKLAVHGETYVAVTEFGDKVKADVILSYGNASQKGNRHVGDQLQMMSEKKLRPALLTRSEILKHLEKRESFRR